MAVTMLREAVDDLYRYRRDTEMNSTLYHKVTRNGVVPIRSSYVFCVKLAIPASTEYMIIVQ